jgi:hypothetical protein
LKGREKGGKEGEREREREGKEESHTGMVEEDRTAGKQSTQGMSKLWWKQAGRQVQVAETMTLAKIAV